MAGTLDFMEYRHTDLSKASSVSSLSLSNGTYFTLIGFIPTSAIVDPQTGEYPNVREVIALHIEGADMDTRMDNYLKLHQWQRKVIQHRMTGGTGNEVWLRWKPPNAGQYAYAKVLDITAQPMAYEDIELRVVREGLWWGDYAVVNVQNTWNSAASTITIQNHMDELTHVYDYHDAAAGTPFTGGSYSSSKPTYLLANAASTGASGVTEVGDGAYYGCSDGMFYGFSLDIATAASYEATMVWEYCAASDAGTWTSFTPTDATSGLKATGVNTITWDSSDVADWTKASVNSVNAYWVRHRVSASATGASPAEVQDSTMKFGIYDNYRSSHSNYFQIAAANVYGDAPALAQIMIQSSTAAAATTRVAKRTIGRVDTYNFFTFPVNNTTASSKAWDGAYSAHTTADSSWNDGIYMPVYYENWGMWQALARNYAATTASTAEFRAELYNGVTDNTLFTGDEVTAPIADNWCICDLGQVNIQQPLGQSGHFLLRQQYIRSSGSTDDINEDALFLMPVDEFYHVAETTNNNTSYKLVLSGIDGQVFVGNGATDAYIYEVCEPMGMPLTLEPNEDNYFFCLNDAANDVNNLMDEYSVTVYHVPRYVNVRGAT